MTGESNRTLYVGNLDPSVTEELILVLFGQLGKIQNCKMFQEANTDPYCFVEFLEHSHALNAITMMNDKMLQNRRMRVDWATGQGNKNKVNKIDTTKHYHVYVGELSPEIDEQALREAFQVFGEISDCKVVKDPQTLKSRGYGFVVFIKKYDAEVSIQNMNGQWLGRKMIKARWATRKLPSVTTPETKPEQTTLDYDEVFNQTTGTNTTVFCGGLKQDITEEALQQAFHSYGPIDKIKIFKEKGYAFIKYTCKEHSCQAIVAQHNATINGQTIRCSWGKDTGPEGQPLQPPSATSPTMLLEHPSLVATPIPAVTSVVAGQQSVSMAPTAAAAAVAAAYANAVAAAAGVPLGMQHMAAAVAGQPIVGAAPSLATAAHYTGQQLPAHLHPVSPGVAPTPGVEGAAPNGIVSSPPSAAGLPPSAAAAVVSSPSSAAQQVMGYWQYYPQAAAAAAAAAAQQQQQQQLLLQQQQQQILAAAAAAHHPAHVHPQSYAYAAAAAAAAASQQGAYMPHYYAAQHAAAAAPAAAPLGVVAPSPHHPHHHPYHQQQQQQVVASSPTSPPAAPPGYMWMYPAGYPLVHPQ